MRVQDSGFSISPSTDSYFKLQKLVVNMAPAPWAKVRGSVYGRFLMALIRNLPRIRQMMVPEPGPSQDPNAPPTRTNYGQLIEEAFNDTQRQLSNLSIQTNASLSAPTNTAPPAINNLHVDGGAGVFTVYITDNNQDLIEE